MHRYSIWCGLDGSYVIHQRLIGGIWWSVASWLIPNSQIED